MRALLNRTLILLTIIGFVFTPPIVTGYAELERAESAMETGDFLGAAMFYERAVKLMPWRQDLIEETGIAHYYAGNSRGAIRFFEDARKRNALSPLGYEWLGQANWAISDFDSAKDAWITGSSVYPNYARYYYYLSKVYFREENLFAEQQMLEQWVSSGGEEVRGESYYRLGQMLTVTEPERAEELFVLASSVDPTFDTVVETMLTTLELASVETNESRKFVVIGRGLGLVDEWTLSSEAFQLAVDADGENSEAWAWLGEAEQQLGQDGRAELDTALKHGRTNPIVRSLRGLYWMRQGREEQALAEYLLAAEYDPENPVWQYALGETYARMGDLPPALTRYQHATELAPTDATSWRLLAVFCTQFGVQIEEVGLPAAQTAVELSGEDPLALDALGWIYTLLERYNEARDALEHAVNLDPTFALGYLHLGTVAIQLEDWDAAHEHLQKARNLDAGGMIGEQSQVLLNQYFP